MFLHMSVIHSVHRGGVPGQVPPLGPGTLPPDQVHPLPPQDQVHTPQTRCPLPPGPGTPPGTRYTPCLPQDQVHTPQTRCPLPPGPGTPPGTRYTPPGPGTLPRRACWEIRSTRGRYASYWNAILFSNELENGSGNVDNDND